MPEMGVHRLHSSFPYRLETGLRNVRGKYRDVKINIGTGAKNTLNESGYIVTVANAINVTANYIVRAISRCTDCVNRYLKYVASSYDIAIFMLLQKHR